MLFIKDFMSNSDASEENVKSPSTNGNDGATNSIERRKR